MKFAFILLFLLPTTCFLQSNTLGHGYDFKTNGKINDITTPPLKTYQLDTLSGYINLTNSSNINSALESNTIFLNRSNYKSYHLG